MLRPHPGWGKGRGTTARYPGDSLSDFACAYPARPPFNGPQALIGRGIRQDVQGR
jgi:hypothetical protein